MLKVIGSSLVKNLASLRVFCGIDKTPPIITLNTSIRDYTQAEQLLIDFDVTDNLSRISSILALFDDVLVSDGEVIDLFYSNLGSHNLVILAEDNASNISTLIQTFNVISTFDSLLQIINRCYQQGLIDNKGVVNSLAKKVERAQKKTEQGKLIPAANILQAFVNEAQAQSGKHVTVWAANLMINNAQYLIGGVYEHASSQSYSFMPEEKASPTIKDTSQLVVASQKRRELPRTGFDLVWWLILALSLILGGVKLRTINR